MTTSRVLAELVMLFLIASQCMAQEENFEYYAYPTTAIGYPGANQGSEITPEGSLFTGRAELLFFLGEDRVPVDQRVKRLVKGYLPIVEFDVERQGVTYTFSYFAETLEGKTRGDLVNYAEVRMLNSGKVRTQGVLWAAFKFSQGDHRIEKTPFNKDWTYSFKDRFAVRAGDALGLCPPGVSSHLATAERKYQREFRGADLGVNENTPVLFTRYEHKLAPGEQRTLHFVVPSVPLPLSKAESLKNLNLRDARSRITIFWDDLLAKGMELEIPESKVMNTYRANLIYLFTGLHQVGDDLITYVNRLQYESFYLRDGSLQLRGMDVFGFHDWVKPATLYFLKHQQTTGGFVSQPGQLDGWGQALWGLGEHYRLNPDPEYARKVFPAVRRGVLWLQWKRQKSKVNGGLGAGLMPPTEPGDAELNYGHVIGNDFWALAGLRDAVILAQGIGEADYAREWQAEVEDYHRSIISALESVVPKFGGWIPPILEGNGPNDWGNHKAVYIGEVLPPLHPWVTSSLNRWMSQSREGLITKLTPNFVHLYIGLDLLQTYLARGEQEKVLEGFYAHLLHTTATQAAPEAADFKRKDFGTNLAPHGCFSGKFLTLLRNMIVREEGDRVHLFSALSPAWVQRGKTVAVRRAPTRFGVLSSTITFEEGEAKLNIEAPRRSPFAGFVVHAPPGYSILEVRKNGTEWRQFNARTISLPPADASLQIRWRMDQNINLSYLHTIKVYGDLLKDQKAEDERRKKANSSNLAFGKQVDSPGGSPLDLFSVSQVVDGDPDTHYLAPLPLSVTVDLGKELDLSRLRVLLFSIQMYLSGPSEHIYSISISKDKKDWNEVVPLKKRRAEAAAWFEHLMQAGTRARYVQVTVVYNSPLESFPWAAIAEIAVE